jgi:hypothetical protein
MAFTHFGAKIEGTKHVMISTGEINISTRVFRVYTSVSHILLESTTSTILNMADLDHLEAVRWLFSGEAMEDNATVAVGDGEWSRDAPVDLDELEEKAGGRKEELQSAFLGFGKQCH